jgi:hypothetical protein
MAADRSAPELTEDGRPTAAYRRHLAGRSRLPRTACAALGVGYVVLGILGLHEGGLGEMGTDTVPPPSLGGLGGSPLLSYAHLVWGVAALLCALSVGSTQVLGMIGSVAFLGLVTYDVVALIASQPGEVFAVRWPAAVLHGVTWAVAVALYLAADAAKRPPHPREDPT